MEPKLPDSPEITERQLEVAKLVAEGLTNRQIAERLEISLDGAKYHVTQLLVRLTLGSREEIGGWYRDRRGPRRRRVRALFNSLSGTLIAPVPPPETAFAPSDSALNGNWGWPTDSRRLTTFFGTDGDERGIDIGADWGTPVVAAEADTVTFVGGDPCCSYGYHVIIEHGNGYSSLYSQLSRFNVSVGQQVSRGQLIGRVGSTGRSTGPHLGFEIRRDAWS